MKHLETHEFTKEMRTNLNLIKRQDKIVLWRKITRTLKEIYEPNSNVNNKKANKNTNSKIGSIIDTMDCENKPNPEGQGYLLPAPSKETCPRSREGIATHAVVAICALNMNVGAVIIDHPP